MAFEKVKTALYTHVHLMRIVVKFIFKTSVSKLVDKLVNVSYMYHYFRLI